MARSKFNLSNYRLVTGDMGFLYPVQLQEILPGDVVRGSTAIMIRVNPLLAPVMHPVSARIHHWYVPHHVSWPSHEDGGFEAFITGGEDGQNNSPIPSWGYTATDWDQNNCLDYMGIDRPGTGTHYIQSLPFRALAHIYNENYRDQDFCDLIEADSPYPLPRIAWGKDYFTTARSTPQKGPDITIPLGEKAFIQHDAVSDNVQVGVYAPNVDEDLKGLNTGGSFLSSSLTGTPAQPLYADLTGATATNVNDWRRAFALQRYQEARMKYGARYPEYVRYLGVSPGDARLNRPEYLGGGSGSINFSEVLQTADDNVNQTNVGTLRGHGIAAIRTRPFTRYFTDHGYIITTLSVRPRALYANGMQRTFTRATREDFWQRELAQIGQQPIYQAEVYSGAAANARDTFGWQDRYAEYKSTKSEVCGEFRDLLDFWHMARHFDSPPALNTQFIECDATKRIHATQEEHALWMMISNQTRARRLVRRSGANRIL